MKKQSSAMFGSFLSFILAGSIFLNTGCATFSKKEEDLESKIKNSSTEGLNDYAESTETINEYLNKDKDRWVSLEGNFVPERRERFGNQLFLKSIAFPADYKTLDKIKVKEKQREASLKGKFEPTEEKKIQTASLSPFGSKQYTPKKFKGELVCPVPEDTEKVKFSFSVDSQKEKITGVVQTFEREELEKVGDLKERLKKLSNREVPVSNVYVLPKEGSHTSEEFAEDHYFDHLNKVFKEKSRGNLSDDFYFVGTGASMRNVRNFVGYNFLPEVFLPEGIFLVHDSSGEKEIISFFYSKRVESSAIDFFENIRKKTNKTRSYVDGPDENESSEGNSIEEKYSMSFEDFSNPFQEGSRNLEKKFLEMKDSSTPLEPNEVIDFLKENKQRIILKSSLDESSEYKENPIVKKDLSGRYFPCFRSFEESVFGLRVSPVRIDNGTYFMIGDDKRIENIQKEISPGAKNKFRVISMEDIKKDYNGTIFYNKIYPDVKGIITDVYDSSTGGYESVGDYADPSKHRRKVYTKKGINVIRFLYESGKKLGLPGL